MVERSELLKEINVSRLLYTLRDFPTSGEVGANMKPVSKHHGVAAEIWKVFHTGDSLAKTNRCASTRDFPSCSRTTTIAMRYPTPIIFMALVLRPP